MAHVIKPPSGHKRVKCGQCFATIAYTPNDVKRVSGTDIGGGPDGHTYLYCPSCKHKIILETW